MASLIPLVVESAVAPLLRCLINKHCCYIFHLRRNLRYLRDYKRDLEIWREDVQQTIRWQEQTKRWRRSNEAASWLERVEVLLGQVNDILDRGDQEIQKTCLSKCFPWTWFSRYKLAKAAWEKRGAVSGFYPRDRVVEKMRPVVDEMSIVRTVGMDSVILDVWTCIQNGSENVIGIHGMGGVGKTTLLKKLNNLFLDTNHNFDLVIWVKVSKNANLEKIQEVILNRLEIPGENWEGKDVDGRAPEICRNLSCIRFVLLLDDVCERLDLSTMGVPLDENQNGSKVVFTTRSEKICFEMQARLKFKLECLSPKDALDLFRDKVSDDVYNSNSETPKLAQQVVDVCQGLPLALVTMGRAMSSSAGPRQWKLAIHELQKNSYRHEDMENDVFPILRFSYDSLSSDTLKNCFLYCSLFPEEHNIRKDELIQLWIGEGFLNEACPRDKGDDIIERLKLAGLLERGEHSEDFVKMHNLIRDMALKLASENNNKTLMQNHVGSIESNKFDGWNDAVRMSLWGSSIDFQLLEAAPSCPQLRTLLVRLTKLQALPIQSRFFESMNALEALDLSDNLELNQLPDVIGRLINLCHLNISNTSIRQLPTGIKRLIKLKVLLLDGMQCLEYIPEGVISSLPSLQVFSCFSTELIEVINPLSNVTRLLDELESLNHLNDLSVTLFSSRDVHRTLESFKLKSCIRRLTIINCHDSLRLLGLGSMLRLETLHIVKCWIPERVDIDPLSLSELCHLSLIGCKGLRDLTWLIHLRSLQFLSLRDCDLQEIIGAYPSGSSEIEESRNNYFQDLKRVDLDGLPQLTSICSGTMVVPSLQTISVKDCPCLRKLPFNSVSQTKSLISIRGSAEWWFQLQWEGDAATMQAFAEKFSFI